LLFISSYNISVPNNSCCIISCLCWSGFGMLLLSETQKSIRGNSHSRYETCPSTPTTTSV